MLYSTKTAEGIFQVLLNTKGGLLHYLEKQPLFHGFL